MLNKWKDLLAGHRKEQVAMTPFDTLPISPVPEFCVVVPDNSLARRMDIRAGDLILCDRRHLADALYVVARYGDELHVCTQLPCGALYDEQTGDKAPDGAEVLGRVAYVLRRWVAEEVTT